MAAISLGFIVIITPWTIQEIVATCTGSKCTGSRSSLEEKCSISLDYNHRLTSLPLPPGPPPVNICRSVNHTPRPDVECSENTDFRALYTAGSDPQVCDHELHDINCAKNKAFFRGFNLHQGLPDI
uniref:Uncharacterized protein n=1 Tax=Anopheles atroparvus TaxID=41427 RepID=A0A182JGW7_ANOAO